MRNFFLSLILLTLLSACTKNDVPQNPVAPAATPTTLLQNKWLIDSVIIYPTSGLSSNYLYAFRAFDTMYEDFRTDGKVYSYGGSPTVYYDTTVYSLTSDNKTILANAIQNGVISTKTDTLYIMELTAHTFIYYNRNPAGEYGKWMLKR